MNCSNLTPGVSKLSLTCQALFVGLCLAGSSGFLAAGPDPVWQNLSLTEAEVRQAVEVFNRAGSLLAKNGLTFFYHNHGFEFVPHGAGTLFDLLVTETKPDFVRFELDVFWAVHPGQDPVKLLQKQEFVDRADAMRERGACRPGSAGRRASMNSRKSQPESHLGVEVELTGRLKFAGLLVFDGTMEGDITGEGMLILGDHALIQGHINAASVVVRGRINGTITAADRIEIKSNAQLFGDITTRSLVIEEGAVFIGQTRLAASRAVKPPADSTPGGLRLGGK